MREKKIELITILDKEYPERLKEIPDPPFGLFVKGKLQKRSCPSVAVIGARDCSPYGEHVAREVAGALVKAGIAVVSGMARGIDGIAQRGALEAGGYSVGVLGSGVDVCYPAQNNCLYEDLVEKGAVVSSFPIGCPAKPLHFPIRNRIVSGLADVVLVVEARRKSGTLITVDMALEQGREVYVVPGRITDSLSQGCVALLSQGASVFTSTEEFVREILGDNQQSLRTVPVLEENSSMSAVAQKVLHVLDFQPKFIHQIMAEIGGEIPLAQVSSNLIRLCAIGKIRQISPGQFCLL